LTFIDERGIASSRPPRPATPPPKGGSGMVPWRSAPSSPWPPRSWVSDPDRGCWRAISRRR